MGFEYINQMPTPAETKQQFPMPRSLKSLKAERDKEVKRILAGEDNRFLAIIGPCSADNETSILDYMNRLAKVAEKIKDKILVVPRVYTNKPRTTGSGYKGLLHQPNPEQLSDLYAGILAVRRMHMRVLKETGMTTADELLYPELVEYTSDLISYMAIGARSVEDQQHRLVSSGMDVPVGMKNPTGGDLSVMMNALRAAQGSHTFIYRNWEVESQGNPLAHAILRGYVDSHGITHPNYHYEDLSRLCELYAGSGLQNPAVIVDTNHCNSGKQYGEQVRIAKEVLHSTRHSTDIHALVKGMMIESYLEDGCQKPDGGVYGKSITDPCLGWEKTERLVLDLAELWV